MIVYFNGEFVPKGDVCISPDDRGFLFADGVYEVICAWNGKLFQAGRHFARLARSLHALHIPSPNLEELEQAVTTLLLRNDLQHNGGKIYIQITRGATTRGHAFPDTPIPPTVYASVVLYHPPRDAWEAGVQAIVVPDIRWARCDIKSLALLPNVLASQRAKTAGAYDAIQIRDGMVTEGSHTSVCAVFKDVLVTHPLTHHILGGVTRDLVLELCPTLGIETRECPILEEELGMADEVMLLGTTTGVMPVIRLEQRRVGTGRPGPITRKLQATLHGMMLGHAS
ncbi:MAG: aminotransferase class IV [Anaerolineae bacterium]|nr:aminotransferase class IV [Anaerolineae bacterium]